MIDATFEEIRIKFQIVLKQTRRPFLPSQIFNKNNEIQAIPKLAKLKHDRVRPRASD